MLEKFLMHYPDRALVPDIVGLLFIGTSLYAANGDLIVNGNEGIGTTDPSFGGKVNSKLSVVPPSGYYGLAIGYSTTQPSLAINPGSDGSWTMFDYAAGSWTPGITQKSGSVGIGTTTSGYKLDVSGDIRSSGTISANNLIGNVTGNVTGSSGSCTGNAATATNATYIRDLYDGTYRPASSTPSAHNVVLTQGDAKIHASITNADNAASLMGVTVKKSGTIGVNILAGGNVTDVGYSGTTGGFAMFSVSAVAGGSFYEGAITYNKDNGHIYIRNISPFNSSGSFVLNYLILGY